MRDKKEILLIGAGDATGGAIAKRFAREGYIACVTRRTEEKLQTLVNEIVDSGGQAHGFSSDARKEEDVVAMIEKIEQDVARIEVAVFNIGANVRFSITETRARVYQKVWEMACFGGFLMGRETAKVMLPRGRGTIIFTGATASLRGREGFAAFASPNAYLCHKVIPQIEARCGVRFDYVPVLLGGLFKLANNRSPMQAYADIPVKMAYERLEMKRFITLHQLGKFKMNPFFPIKTLAIMRGAIAAQKLGCFAAYANAMYAAMWEQGLNLAEQAEIGKVLQAAGLDAQALMDAAQLPDVKEGLLASTQSAFERGAFGSPTFFVGNEMFSGKDRLGQVELEITRATAS